MFHSHVSFICYPSIPVCSRRLSRAIHQHTFSRLASAQFTDCMTCLTSKTFLFCLFTHYCIFASFSMFEFAHVWACICLHMFISMFLFVCNFSASLCPHIAKQSTNTLLVAWPAHNLLIAWLASPDRRFYSIFHTLLLFYQFFNVLVSIFLRMYLSSHVYSYVFINLQSFRLSVSPHWSAEQSTSMILVAWPVHKALVASTASPHIAQQSYQPHSAIDPILLSTLSPSKTPGTFFRLTSDITLQFRVTLR